MKSEQGTRAFSLVELLVVMAIVAILAAILFPVFAQAREGEKRAQGLQQQKQLASAILAYVSDNNDHYPAGITRRGDGSWRYYNFHPFPQNAIASGGWSDPEAQRQAAGHWGNAVYPYIKDTQAYVGPNGKASPQLSVEFAKGVQPGQSNANYNGLLQFLSSSAVDNPHLVPLVYYKDTGVLKGFTIAAPTLRCQTKEDICVYNPGGLAQPSNPSGNQSYFPINPAHSINVMGRGTIVTRADSSAKWIPVGFGIRPNFVPSTEAFKEPYASVTQKGDYFSYWTTCPDGIDDYVCYFRPDRPE